MKHGFVCRLVFIILAIVSLAYSTFSYAGQLKNKGKMASVYSDESHCLVAPEIRREKDSQISCSCRDAIMDARYVYENYLLTNKDPNLRGDYLTLVDHAKQVCGESYERVLKVTTNHVWHWNGPQVIRTYPSETEIHKLQPDRNGFRMVRYKASLIYRDAGGHITRLDSFTALEKFPPESWWPKKKRE